MNKKNPSQCVIREFASDFEEGECWGYNRFFQIDLLDKDGYLDEDDSITLHFYVRPPTFYQLCKDQKKFIEQLEATRAEYALREAEWRHQVEQIQAQLLKEGGEALNSAGKWIGDPKLRYSSSVSKE